MLCFVALLLSTFSLALGEVICHVPTLAGGSFEPPIGPAPDGNFPVGASITVKCDSENNVISFFDDETGDLDMVHSGETLTCAPHGEHPLWIHKAETKKYIHGSDMECLAWIKMVKEYN